MRSVILFFFATGIICSYAQTKTTQSLDEKYGGLSLFFYRNTLRMLNQSEDKSFDELIKDIEKMRFLMIDKTNSTFNKEEYKKLLADYKSEEYEEMMTGRYEGRDFNVFVREKSGDVKGTILLASDSSSLLVLDILGKIALDKAPQLFKTIDESTDIGKRVKNFMGDDDDKGEEKAKGEEDKPAKNKAKKK
jgi:Domain of unknown function (DUF4252)